MELRSKRILKYSLVRFSKVKEIKYYFISQKEKTDKVKCYNFISKTNKLN